MMPLQRPLLVGAVSLLCHGSQGMWPVLLGTAPIALRQLRASLCASQLPTLSSYSSAAPTSARAPAPTPRARLDFNNYQAVYASRTTGELLRAYFVLRLCGINSLVTHADTLLHTSRRLFGDGLTLGIIRGTFFKHFCAGEDAATIAPTLNALRRAGIGAILDFAAEDEEGGSPARTPATRPDGSSMGGSSAGAPGAVAGDGAARMADAIRPENKEVVARTYNYEDEQQCDRHVEVFLHAIDTVSKLPGQGFAAIKVTALGNPKLLQVASSSLLQIRQLFKQSDVDGSGRVDVSEFCALYAAMFPHATEAEAQRVFKRFDLLHDGQVDYVSWEQALQLKDMPAIAARLRRHGVQPGTVQEDFVAAALSEEEVSLVDAMIKRVSILADAATKGNVKLMIDAEHTYFQPAIDHTVKALQRRYNKGSPLIYNTYQAYLKDSAERMADDITRAKREGYKFGAKIVRGAYLELERRRARQNEYPSPIHESLQQTHTNYDACVTKVLHEVKNSGAEVMVASHNQHSVELAVARMDALGLPPGGGAVYFGQLLGMADNLSYTLGANKYQSFKYVPYGPVELVIPYLIRRAQENSSVMGAGMAKEVAELQRELQRRMWPWRRPSSGPPSGAPGATAAAAAAL